MAEAVIAEFNRWQAAAESRLVANPSADNVDVLRDVSTLPGVIKDAAKQNDQQRVSLLISAIVGMLERREGKETEG